MKRKVVNLLMAVAMVVSGVVAYNEFSSAANYSYSFNNYNSVGYTSWKSKTDYSKVFLHPTSGPELYYTVQGKRGDGTVIVASTKHKIYVGTYASFTNLVKENGCVSACFKMERVNASPMATSGEWNPNSLRNYTIYN